MDYGKELSPVFETLGRILQSAARRLFEDDVTEDICRANNFLHSGKSKLLKASRERKQQIRKAIKKAYSGLSSITSDLVDPGNANSKESLQKYV